MNDIKVMRPSRPDPPAQFAQAMQALILRMRLLFHRMRRLNDHRTKGRAMGIVGAGELNEARFISCQ